MRARVRHPPRDPPRDGAGLRQLQGAGLLLTPPLRGVLLDAGNTLVFVDSRKVVPVLIEAGAHGAAALWDVAERDARLALSLAHSRDGAHAELRVWQDYFDHIIRATGVAEERCAECAAALQRAHADDHLWTRVQEGALAALGRVREMGYRLGIVSNADGRVEALLRSVGLADAVEFVLDSHAVGVAKPDPRIFRMGAERLGLAPAECLYVGDLYAIDVVGARAAGMRPLLLDPFDRLGGWDDVDRIPSVAELPAWLAARAREE